MTNRPFASIVVPAYNAGATLDDLLQSLLSQTYPRDRLEIIIVDNNSQDDTAYRASRYPVTVLHERHIQSSYAARNRGIAAAQGDIIAFTDADCVAHPDWLRYLLADYDDPGWGGFAGGFEAYPPRTEVERYLADSGAWGYAQDFIQGPFFAPQSAGQRLCVRLRFLDYRAEIPLPSKLVNPPTANVAYKRQLFDEIGPFDLRLTSGGDVEFAWRVQTETHWRIKITPKAKITHRHRQDLSSMAKQFRKNGWGYGLLALHMASKNGSDTRRVARQLAGESLILISLSLTRHPLALCTRVLRGLFQRPSDSQYLMIPFYTLVGSLNYYWGRLTAARKGREWLSRRDLWPSGSTLFYQ
jgi:glycosyltransferase involved in cell wall biosynthesis